LSKAIHGQFKAIHFFEGELRLIVETVADVNPSNLSVIANGMGGRSATCDQH
jgi:hypothetical protein